MRSAVAVIRSAAFLARIYKSFLSCTTGGALNNCCTGCQKELHPNFPKQIISPILSQNGLGWKGLQGWSDSLMNSSAALGTALCSNLGSYRALLKQQGLVVEIYFPPDSRKLSELWFKPEANLRGGYTHPYHNLFFSISMNSPACCKLHVWFRFRTSSNYLCIQQEFKTLSMALEYKHLKGSQTPTDAKTY